MKRVLVVDDDLGVRRLARLALSAAGFEVALASDGREALAFLSNDSADVIVLDLNMPVMDGYTFFHNLDDVRYRPHVLILSGDRAEMAQRELGADASLQKPFLPEELIAKVSELSDSMPAAGRSPGLAGLAEDHVRQTGSEPPEVCAFQ